MNQHDINTGEWSDPANWSGKHWLGVYFRKRDSRAWVRKPVPALGWTVNSAQPRGAASAVAIIIASTLAASLLVRG